MNKNQSSIRNVSPLITTFITKNSSIFSPIPGLSSYNTQLVNNYNLTNTLSEQQEANRTGHTSNKNGLKTDLVNKAFEVCEKCYVYATQANNQVLLKEMSYTFSKLNKCGSRKLRDRAILIYDRAIANQANLASYNITAAMLAALKTAIDNYTASIINKRTSTVEGKQISDQIQSITVSSRGLIKKILLLARVIRTAQPTIYQGLLDIANSVDTSCRQMTLRTSITDSNAQALKGVRVEFYLKSEHDADPSIKPLLVKTTKEKGMFNIQNLADGTYTIIISKTGYKSQTQTVNIAAGDFKHLKISLTSSEAFPPL